MVEDDETRNKIDAQARDYELFRGTALSNKIPIQNLDSSIAGVLMVDVLLNYKGLLGVLLVFVLHHLVMKENGTHSDLFIRKEIGCSTRD